MKTILTIYFLPVLLFAGNDSLTGVWQDRNYPGSVWGNTYMFYPTGEFRFYFSQTDCSKRMVSYSGSWSLAEEEVIDLMITSKTLIEGGKLVPSTGNCASDSMIVGGDMKVLVLYVPEKMDLSISRIYKDNDGDIQRDVIYIDGMKFWKFGNNPDDFIRYFEK